MARDPDSFELPGVLRSVVELVRAHLALVEEHVAFPVGHAVRSHEILGLAPGRIPRPAAVIRALDDLAEPAAGLRRINPVWIHSRALEMIHLPAREVRSADVPILALAIRR